MLHATDRLIGTTTHHNPYIQPPPMYGTPQYPSIYGGSSYYPPLLYQHPYLVALPPPMNGPLPIPIMRSTYQPSLGAPSTSTYNLGTSESVMPSYAPYKSFPQKKLYFPFPSPPQHVSPPQGQPHDIINFVQPFPIQQFHFFEYLNTKNLVQQLNNSKTKGKNQNNNNSGPGGNHPQQNQPDGGN
jgi:hypothetical protein